MNYSISRLAICKAFLFFQVARTMVRDISMVILFLLVNVKAVFVTRVSILSRLEMGQVTKGHIWVNILVSLRLRNLLYWCILVVYIIMVKQSWIFFLI